MQISLGEAIDGLNGHVLGVDPVVFNLEDFFFVRAPSIITVNKITVDQVLLVIEVDKLPSIEDGVEFWLTG